MHSFIEPICLVLLVLLAPLCLFLTFLIISHHFSPRFLLFFHLIFCRPFFLSRLTSPFLLCLILCRAHKSNQLAPCAMTDISSASRQILCPYLSAAYASLSVCVCVCIHYYSGELLEIACQSRRKTGSETQGMRERERWRQRWRVSLKEWNAQRNIWEITVEMKEGEGVYQQQPHHSWLACFWIIHKHII